MKIFKGKAFFFKTILLQIFLIALISFISITFWENSIYDIFIQNSKATVESTDDTILIMVDNKSITRYRWPWDRRLYAEIFDYLQYSKPKVVVFDTILRAMDTNNTESDKRLFDSVKRTDRFIGAYIAQTAQYDNEETGKIYDEEFRNKNSISITDNSHFYFDYSPNYYNSIVKTPKQYFDVQQHIGAANHDIDKIDGVMRESTDLIYYKDNLYPSISLYAYLIANDADQLTITNKYLLVNKTNLKIPIKYTKNGNLGHLVKFYKFRDNKYTHNAISAVDIIDSYRLIKNGKKPLIDPAIFNNKAVIIGINASNEAEDTLETPISSKHSGPDVQATILDNFLHNEFLYPLTAGQNMAIIILMSILSFSIIRVMPFLPSLLTLMGMAILYFIICILAFANNIVPLVITPLAVQISTMIFGYSYRFILEGKNKEKIKNAMGKYLSQDIMKNVVQNIDDIKLGGKKANVTVLFSDIRGFTSMSEKMTAEEVSMILNEYFSEMEPIITKYNGVINKFIGDAVMAIFGEPIQDLNHSQNAVKCAVEMLKKVEQLREKWLQEGKPKIEIGIGINTGEAFVGNIGSEKRLEYTVIGDTVNLASRIESYNKVYKTNLLISSSTYSHVSDIVDVIKIADVTIRGKSKKMDIYEVLKLSD